MHLIYGCYKIVNADGSIAKEEPIIVPNFLAQEGEQSVLNVFLLGQSNPSKYLALLSATPTASTTMATMTEAQTPGSNGYSRIQVNTSDWSSPSLSSGDYVTNAVVKTFGPASGANWTGITYVALVTTSSGTSGKFLAAIALAATETVLIGQSLLYQLNTKAITV